MKTFSASLSDEDADALEAASERYPGVATHAVHVALLRIALRTSSTESVSGELARIQQERRLNRRALTGEAQPMHGADAVGDNAQRRPATHEGGQP